MTLLLGLLILALAVSLGGLAAFWRDRARAAMPAVRTFAVVAAGSIALLHLLPEAIAEVGWTAILATAAGLFGPALLERMLPSKHGAHHHRAPTTALAMGYAAVIAHQLGEGAALASLAHSGALSASVILAVAAHTVPLAMVVAMRVLESAHRHSTPVAGAAPHASRGSFHSPGAKRATGLALAGVAGATALGAVLGHLVGAESFETIAPWVLAAVAGLLLHALSHDEAEDRPTSTGARTADAVLGLAGLGIGTLGAHEHQHLPLALEVGGIAAVAVAIVARSFWPRRPAQKQSVDTSR